MTAPQHENGVARRGDGQRVGNRLSPIRYYLCPAFIAVGGIYIRAYGKRRLTAGIIGGYDRKVGAGLRRRSKLAAAGEASFANGAEHANYPAAVKPARKSCDLAHAVGIVRIIDDGVYSANTERIEAPIYRNMPYVTDKLRKRRCGKLPRQRESKSRVFRVEGAGHGYAYRHAA